MAPQRHVRAGSLSDIPDMLSATCDIVRQVPEGRVTTYGQVARALGDVSASMYVHRALQEVAGVHDVPGHRVVRSDGLIRPEGNCHQAEVLADEGVRISGGKVRGMDGLLFSDFETARPLLSLRSRQVLLRGQLRTVDSWRRIDMVAGVDVSYSGDRAFGSVVVFDARSGEEESSDVVQGDVRFPYIPTFLAFRELPILEPLLRDMDSGTLVMYDGNGVLHPEGFGVASHAGVEFDLPTVGVAKKLLCGAPGRRSEEQVYEIIVDGVRSGYSVSCGIGKKPVYVSPGHKVSFEFSLSVARQFMRRRVPEPIRRAHTVAESARRAISDK